MRSRSVSSAANKLLLIVFLSSLLFQTVFASSQTDSGVALPSTAVGKLATGALEALNSGDEQKILDFIRHNYAEQSLKETSASDLLAFFIRLHRQSGGLKVMKVLPESNERFLVLDAKSKRADHWARMFFILRGAQQDKLTEIGIFGIRDPEAEKAEVWPQGRLSEAAVVRAIRQRV